MLGVPKTRRKETSSSPQAPTPAPLPPEHGAAHAGSERATMRFDAVGQAAPDDRHPASGDLGAGDDHGALAAADGHAHAGDGAGAGVGLLLALAGSAVFTAGATARRRLLAGQLAAAGVGAQLAGLGWDVVKHAQAGEAVHLLENGGHWTALVGLAVTGAAAVLLLGSPSRRGDAGADAGADGGVGAAN